MSNQEYVYSVVLRDAIPIREKELLGVLCCKITHDEYGDLLHFMCTSIDLTHPIYLQMETFKLGNTSTHPIKIPHHYVFLNSGSEDTPEIGFLAKVSSK